VIDEIKAVVVYILYNLPKNVNYGKLLELTAVKQLGAKDQKLYSLLEIVI